MGYVCPFLKKRAHNIKKRTKTFPIKKKLQDYLTQMHRKLAYKKSAAKKPAY